MSDIQTHNWTLSSIGQRTAQEQEDLNKAFGAVWKSHALKQKGPTKNTCCNPTSGWSFHDMIADIVQETNTVNNSNFQKQKDPC